MKQIGTAVLEALTLEGSLIAQSEFQTNAERNRDGSVYCWLTGGTGRDQSVFIRAMREVLRPIENPQYLLTQNRFWRLFRENYFSVPEASAARISSRKPSQNCGAAGGAGAARLHALSGRPKSAAPRAHALALCFLPTAGRADELLEIENLERARGMSRTFNGK